eukprot:5742279-Amphidinium_carterae.2
MAKEDSHLCFCNSVTVSSQEPPVFKLRFGYLPTVQASQHLALVHFVASLQSRAHTKFFP